MGTGKLRLGAAQIHPAFADKRSNLEKVLAYIKKAAAGRVDLAVFPECALTGYCFASRGPAYEISEPIPGPATDKILEVARREGIHVVVGLLERQGDEIYNSAALLGRGGVLAVHRKAHLPFIGVDRFCALGDRPMRPAATPFGPIGLLICFEMSLPEPARALKLAGAQLVLVPTNWPRGGSQISSEHAPFVRAYENHVNFAAVNRVGAEGEFEFYGKSVVVGSDGKLVLRTDAAETLAVAEIDMQAASANRVVHRPGEYEVDRLASRRPELY